MPSSRESTGGVASQARTVDRLRADTDAGLTGDKVQWPDPAAAPMGTDDEAAGVPGHMMTAGDQPEPTGAPHPPQHRHGLGGARIHLLVTLVIAVIVLGAVLLRAMF